MTARVDGRSRGLIYILAATAVAGAVGYLIQLLAPALLPDADRYLTFSVFWSTLYLFVAAIAGVQQEVTRATSVAVVPSRSTTLRAFTLLAAGALALVTIVVGLVIAPVALPDAPLAMTAWFGLGVVGYLFSAVLAGVMYGLSLWRAIAALTIADALIRGLLVGTALVVGLPSWVLAAAVTAPFFLAFGLIWLTARANVVGRFVLDVGARRLTLNALSTVIAAAATGVMVTGLPLLLRTAMPHASAVVIASLIMTITITRAPLIVPLMALQSFLVVDFRGAGASMWPRLLRYLLIAAAGTALASGAAYLWGPPIIGWISSGRYGVDGWTTAAIVLSAGLVAMMCLTGPALLSENQHMSYTGGWVLAAVVTAVLLIPPLEPTLRTTLAVVVGPVIGLVVHLVGIRWLASALSAEDTLR